MSNNPSNKKEALNRGIRSLLGSIDSDMKNTAGGLKEEVVAKTTSTSKIPLEDILANPRQPRQDFDKKAIEELAESIRMHDIIQPLTVTKLPNGKYKLIAGERRWRAAKLAELKEVPVYINFPDVNRKLMTSSCLNSLFLKTCKGKTSILLRLD